MKKNEKILNAEAFFKINFAIILAFYLLETRDLYYTDLKPANLVLFYDEITNMFYVKLIDIESIYIPQE